VNSSSYVFPSAGVSPSILFPVGLLLSAAAIAVAGGALYQKVRTDLSVQMLYKVPNTTADNNSSDRAKAGSSAPEAKAPGPVLGQSSTSKSSSGSSVEPQSKSSSSTTSGSSNAGNGPLSTGDAASAGSSRSSDAGSEGLPEDSSSSSRGVSDQADSSSSSSGGGGPPAAAGAMALGRLRCPGDLPGYQEYVLMKLQLRWRKRQWALCALQQRQHSRVQQPSWGGTVQRGWSRMGIGGQPWLALSSQKTPLGNPCARHMPAWRFP
jgi:hypothetical protein